MYRQLTEVFHDVFGEEHGAIFLFVSNRVIVNGVDDMDFGWVYDRAVREPKDVYKLVSEYGRVYSQQGGGCRPQRGRWDCELHHR